MKIRIYPYDPRWQDAFLAEVGCLSGILRENGVQVFHIGSTSVPGLAAKPVIDIMPVVLDIAAVDGQTAQFAAIGYEAMGEYGISGRRFFRKGGDERTHHVHIFAADDTQNILRHLAFRDYLRCHPDVCGEYAALKTALAARHPDDIDAYCDGKDAFVKCAEGAALQWFWKSYPHAGHRPCSGEKCGL